LQPWSERARPLAWAPVLLSALPALPLPLSVLLLAQRPVRSWPLV
jgi:hypothetical protein